jgi:hypothetical protein
MHIWVRTWSSTRREAYTVLATTRSTEFKVPVVNELRFMSARKTNSGRVFRRSVSVRHQWRVRALRYSVVPLDDCDEAFPARCPTFGLVTVPLTRPKSSAPLVVLSVEQLQHRLAVGQWAVGKIRSENELSTPFSVSRNTVCEAIGGLVHAGVLEPRASSEKVAGAFSAREATS